MNNKVIVAAAGAGKTEYIVKAAYNSDGPVLITTFTIENTEEIRARFYKLYGMLPSNITILPWFTFLLRFLIKPFQNIFIPQNIRGILMENQVSAKFTKKTSARHYLSNDNRLFSDKVGTLALKFIEDFKNYPLTNLGNIFSSIFIDEMQDMGASDLDILGVLLKSEINVIGVCDPRQTTYQTSNGHKNKNCKGENIVEFFKKNNIPIDCTSLNTNYRCHTDMIRLSNLLYPDFLESKCGTDYNDSHMGVFFIKHTDVEAYKENYEVQELRFNKTTTKNYPNFKGKNIGDVKGRTFKRTILFLPSTHLDWLLNQKKNLEGKSRAILYVGLTRAQLSTCIVCDYKDDFKHTIIKRYIIDNDNT